LNRNRPNEVQPAPTTNIVTVKHADFHAVSLDEEPDEGFETIRASTARRRVGRFMNSQVTPSRRPRMSSEWMGDGLGSNKDFQSPDLFRWSRLSEVWASVTLEFER
jgi:hypothetical protein